MSKSKTTRPPMHTEPPAVRRKLAETYRRRAADPKLTPQERRTFASMADAWQATLDEN